MGAAEDFLNQQQEQTKAAMLQEYNSAWKEVNTRFGPRSPNVQVELARRQQLLQLHQQYTLKAQQMLGKFKQKQAGFNEIDTMAKNGMISPDAVDKTKMGMVVSPEARQAMEAAAKAPKETNPVTQWGQLETTRNRVESELKNYQPKAPRSQESLWKPWTWGAKDTPPKLVVSHRQFDEDEGKIVTSQAEATPEEQDRFEQLRNFHNQITSAQKKIIGSDPLAARIRMAAMRSPRMGNQETFAENAIGESNEPSVKSAPTQPLPAPPSQAKTLDVNTARQYLSRAGGDADKARRLARQEGYSF